MAKARVVHSEDAATIIFEGDKARPEPSTGVIKFPGGFVEVSRTSEGKYWAHIYQDESKPLSESRIDYSFEGYEATGGKIPDIPHADKIKHIAVLVG